MNKLFKFCNEKLNKNDWNNLSLHEEFIISMFGFEGDGLRDF